jgi:hypothetical protein
MRDVEDRVIERLMQHLTAPTGMSGPEAAAHVRAALTVAFTRLRPPADVSAERAARTCFRDIRFCFALNRQAAVWRLVLHGCEYAERSGASRATAARAQRRCPVLTRSGTACRRAPLPNGWCPSHQHLVEERFVRMATLAGA